MVHQRVGDPQVCKNGLTLSRHQWHLEAELAIEQELRGMTEVLPNDGYITRVEDPVKVELMPPLYLLEKVANENVVDPPLDDRFFQVGIPVAASSLFGLEAQWAVRLFRSEVVHGVAWWRGTRERSKAGLRDRHCWKNGDLAGRTV